MQTRSFRVRLALAAALTFVACTSSLSPEPAVQEAAGLMFANFCQASGAMLVCTPVRLSVPSGGGGGATAAKLPEITQPINPGMISDKVLLMHGATIDRTRGLVFWQAACANHFFTTDILTGATKTLSLDFVALGIAGAEGGLCLNEWVFDEATGSAIALGGAPLASGHGKVQFMFALKADGSVKVLHDLRAALAQERAFVHPNQSVVSFDPTRREILTSGTFVVGGNLLEQQRLSVGVDTGSIAVVAGGAAVQAQFFDRTRGKHVLWSCRLPGLTDESSLEIKIGADDLRENNLNNVDDLCYQGFLGGVYDPEEERFLVLARPGAIAHTGEKLSIGVIDLKTNRWSRWIATDARYDTFKVTTESGDNLPVVPGKTFFFSTVYAPCGGSGPRCP